MSEVVTRERAARVEFPFACLAPLDDGVRARIEAEALRVNDRYLEEFLEKYAFCPYSREGRRRGEVQRYVHFCDSHDPEPLVERMRQVAADESQVVAQVIFPLIDVSAVDFERFCRQLTDYAHSQLFDHDVLAAAPLHPDLRFTQSNPEALIPLFRRTPDPTLQWVRLDALQNLYSGRESDTVFVDASSIDSYLRDNAGRTPLYETIAQANAKMLQRLSVPTVEALLSDIARDARDSYARILA
ncbi:MAG: DUF1415 family protein [Polyangiaceae bacterium]